MYAIHSNIIHAGVLSRIRNVRSSSPCGVSVRMKKVTTIDIEKEDINELFAAPHEKGVEEWESVDAVLEDSVDITDY